eukprot:5028284-Lingulodinium_polyedra.AAC.1
MAVVLEPQGQGQVRGGFVEGQDEQRALHCPGGRVGRGLGQEVCQATAPSLHQGIVHCSEQRDSCPAHEAGPGDGYL